VHLDFTNNALARMMDRGIQEQQIEAALETPDHLGPSFEKRWCARKQMDQRTLEVIFHRTPSHAQVITAFWRDGTV
jgi:hypothetical protein